jgi:hypothetical protein
MDLFREAITISSTCKKVFGTMFLYNNTAELIHEGVQNWKSPICRDSTMACLRVQNEKHFSSQLGKVRPFEGTAEPKSGWVLQLH